MKKKKRKVTLGDVVRAADEAGMEVDVKVARVPVHFNYAGLNPEFLKCMAEIVSFADEKYGRFDLYAIVERMTGEASPVNHMYEHLRQYQAGEPYDHFEGDVGRHLVAIAYNAMMEWFYLKRFGFVPHPLAPPEITMKTHEGVVLRRVGPPPEWLERVSASKLKKMIREPIRAAIKRAMVPARESYPVFTKADRKKRKRRK